MKYFLTCSAIAFCLLVTAAFCQDTSLGIPGSNQAKQNPIGPASKAYRTPIATQQVAPAESPSFATIVPSGPIASFYSQSTEKRATRAALQKFKEAEDDDARSDAKNELREALEQEYDSALDAYDKHLEQLRQKISELREQIERRRDAKQEMVELKLQMLIHEADGLGWPGQSSNWFTSPTIDAIPPFVSPPPTAPRRGGQVR